MVPPAAALLLDDDLAGDPVWLAAKNAPPCSETFSDEELASFETAIDDFKSGRVQAVGREEILATIEHQRRAQGE